MNRQAPRKRLSSPLTDDDIGRILELKSLGFATMEITCMLSRNESTIRSFAKTMGNPKSLSRSNQSPQEERPGGMHTVNGFEWQQFEWSPSASRRKRFFE
jgi:hypothetical protein